MDIQYVKMDFHGTVAIEPMWEKLNILYERLSANFNEVDSHMSTEKRFKSFMDKAQDGKLAVYIAKNYMRDEIEGYCVCLIDKCGTGEIDSLFIDKRVNEKKIREGLFIRAVEWLQDNGAIDMIMSVPAGKEFTMNFYAKYGFLPIKHVLKKMKL